jgi:chemotaxis-related protein WspB
MLLLTFQAGAQTYGIDVRNVIQLAPYPACTPLPHAPAYIAGLATWRGQTLPVIDLSALLDGTPARPLLSTRLLIVDYPCPKGGTRPLGLLAGKAVETIKQEEALCEPQKVAIPEAPYLNGTAEHDGRLIQRLAVEELLPTSVQQLLFPNEEGG